MAEQGVPQIADITPQQAPAQQSSMMADALARTAQMAKAPLPSQYSQGVTQQAPRIPRDPAFTPRPEHQAPIGGGSAMLKAQDQRNSIASLSNMIGKAGQALQQKKNDALKSDITDYMQAKTNAENAAMVLKHDPQNKDAQEVLAKNKQALTNILSDKKKQKEMAKAFDISFTDPEQNKTPEIAVGQAAIKQFKQNGIYNASNPQEAKIAQLAQQGGKPQQQQQPRQSLADQAMAKDLPSLENNPQYAPAVAQRDAAQKALMTNIIPKYIEAEAAAQRNLATQGNANARANLKTVTDYYKVSQDNINKNAQLDREQKNRMLVEGARFSHNMAEAKWKADAAVKLADSKKLDPANTLKLQTDAMDTIDKSIASQITDGATLQARMKVAPDEEKPALQAQMDMNDKNLAQTQQFRQDTAKKFYGITNQPPKPPPQDGNTPQGANYLKQFVAPLLSGMSSAYLPVMGTSGSVPAGGGNNAAGSSTSGNANTSASGGSSEQSRPNIQSVGQDPASNTPEDDDHSDDALYQSILDDPN